jgi:hypothetical protein
MVLALLLQCQKRVIRRYYFEGREHCDDRLLVFGAMELLVMEGWELTIQIVFLTVVSFDEAS